MSEQSTPGPDDQRLAELIGPAVEESGLVLEHVALKPAGTGLVLQVLVDLPEDSTDSVDIDRIAAVSRAVSELLDRTDPVPGSTYELEVSSPGATRELAAPRHWRRSIGRLVRVTPVEGEKFTARLLEVGQDGVVLQRSHQVKKGMPARLLDPERWAFEAVRRARVEVEFTD
ncbi:MULTISPECIES: ribosome maturation factor RimP [Kocuria]|uniref:ribosome maturation factor RimP n=1 Tax=Kocuria TaxID=57493 RepID=UPI00036EE680|nr:MULTISPECIES: ribosome maturation factor RimP [Kocuria]EYT52640.1 ribosome maturation factor RimP [Kocuria sp. UCD-OTCP]MCM3486401.1 ribosome maturation factor RimP [Kocuria rosea]WJZ65382.1 ribosome maturation factor RimP [Kocuria rosea]